MFSDSRCIEYRGMEQLVARRAHNPKVTGSSPVPATNLSSEPKVHEQSESKLCMSRLVSTEVLTSNIFTMFQFRKLCLYRGVEQLVARRAHNPKATGSSPVPATNVYYCFKSKDVKQIYMLV